MKGTHGKAETVVMGESSATVIREQGNHSANLGASARSKKGLAAGEER